MAENLQKKWYVVQTYKNKEREVKENLETAVKNVGLDNMIFRIIVAEKEIDELDSHGKPTGKKKVENYYPGYIFIEMIMTDDSWHFVRNYSKVTGLIGSSGKGTKPFPMDPKELEPILKRLRDADASYSTDYKVGQEIRIVTGTFEDTIGTITAVMPEEKKAKVSIIFFGRPQEQEFDFSEIESIENN